MKTKILFCLLVTLSFFSASAQSGAEWNAYKRANGINPSWTYNQWVAAGMPRGGGGNSGASQADIAAQQAAAAAAAARNAAAQAQQKLAKDAYGKSDYATAEAEYKKCLDYWPNDPTILGNIANCQNREGLAAGNKGDWTTAMNYFQQALATDPATDDRRHFITEDIAVAQEKIAKVENAQKSKIAVNNIIQNLAQTVNTAPASGGLDFDGDNSGNTTNGGTELKGLDDAEASLNMATTNSGTVLKGFVFTAAHSNTKGAIKGEMDNIAGDTYFVKFSNSSGDTYRIHYIINDEGKIIQDENTMAVQGHSSNANGPYHCGPNATIKVIKADKI